LKYWKTLIIGYSTTSKPPTAAAKV
jgi:hypothetical protein